MREPKIAILGINCVGHGISVQTNALLRYLKASKHNVKFFYPIEYKSRLKTLLVRGLNYILFYIWVSVNRPEKVVILANYFPLRLRPKKIVILRHAHLVEISEKDSVLDKIRRLIFGLTIQSTHKLIVQTDDIREKFLSMYNFDSEKIEVLPNPIRDISTCSAFPLPVNVKGKFVGIYPSGYYPHKGLHDLFSLLFSHSRSTSSLLIFLPFEKCELSQIELEMFDSISLQAPELVVFLGKLHPDSLNYIFSISDFGVFPSKKESFGNGMYEMESLGLPFLYSEHLTGPMSFVNGKPVGNWLEFELDTFLNNLPVSQPRKCLPTVDEWYRSLSR